MITEFRLEYNLSCEAQVKVEQYNLSIRFYSREDKKGATWCTGMVTNDDGSSVISLCRDNFQVLMEDLDKHLSEYTGKRQPTPLNGLI